MALLLHYCVMLLQWHCSHTTVHRCWNPRCTTAVNQQYRSEVSRVLHNLPAVSVVPHQKIENDMDNIEYAQRVVDEEVGGAG